MYAVYDLLERYGFGFALGGDSIPDPAPLTFLRLNERRVPGFRKDDAPRVFLAKLRWCLEYASGNRLLPPLCCGSKSVATRQGTTRSLPVTFTASAC